MPKTRPPYPEEFRREAVALIRSGLRSLAETSKSLGVSQQTLRNWLKQENVGCAFELCGRGSLGGRDGMAGLSGV